MSRILLADDSPHAQRMGEKILREDGHEVVTVTDGRTALLRLADVDPDLVFADISLPSISGYEICREVKSRERHAHVRVVLTAGLLEFLDEDQAAAVFSDAVLRKPFEASVVLETVRPLLDAAQRDRGDLPPYVEPEPVELPEEPAPPPPPPTVIDEERVRAAVTLALDAALPDMIDKITGQLLVALRT